MKKNLNVIQINGIRGLCMAAFIVTCLAAGFIAFPGMIAMKLWNLSVSHLEYAIPTIGLFQGVLLWGIITASYFIFRKDKLVVCVKSPKGLDEEELKTVFADMRRQAQKDKILEAMRKAKEAELKFKNTKSTSQEQSETVENKEHVDV